MLMWHRMFSKLRKILEGLGSTSNVACLIECKQQLKAGMDNVVSRGV